MGTFGGDGTIPNGGLVRYHTQKNTPENATFENVAAPLLDEIR